MARRTTPLYQQIAESLRRQIASGDLTSGSRLPSVRDAAVEWKCDPGTVGRAYALLAEEGLVESHSGGGTRVTSGALDPGNPAWRWASLVNRAEAYLLESVAAGHAPEQAENALAVAAARWSDLQRTEPAAPGPAGSGGGLRFAGSHDLAMEMLVREVAPKVSLQAEYLGSLGGLMALAREEADVAGTHLWDESSGDYNAPFVRRVLPGRRIMLLTLAHRSLGLIVPEGNPKQIAALGDLSGLTFVNRQRGSGTRVWLDAHLRAAGIDPAAIAGYEREEGTHLAVARAVERGDADAGLGIGAAAAASGLGFVALTRERYDLVFPESVWGTAPAGLLVEGVLSPGFRAAVEQLGGYDAAETGGQRWVGP